MDGISIVSDFGEITKHNNPPESAYLSPGGAAPFPVLVLPKIGNRKGSAVSVTASVVDNYAFILPQLFRDRKGFIPPEPGRPGACSPPLDVQGEGAALELERVNDLVQTEVPVLLHVVRGWVVVHYPDGFPVLRSQGYVIGTNTWSRTLNRST